MPLPPTQIQSRSPHGCTQTLVARARVWSGTNDIQNVTNVRTDAREDEWHLGVSFDSLEFVGKFGEPSPGRRIV